MSEIPHQSIPAALEAIAQRLPDGEAVVDGDARISWAELAAGVEAAARGFVAAGLEPGDRVGIWAPNCWEWVVAVVGLQAAGGVVVPLNSRYKGAEAAWILTRSRARLLVTVDGFLGNSYVGMLADQDLPHVERLVVLRDPVPDRRASSRASGPGDRRPHPTQTWADFLDVGSDTAPEVVAARRDALTPATVNDIIFTSGTTGKPKGVITTHGQALRAFTVWADLAGLTDDDRYLIVNPFFHSFGYRAGIVACILTGATMVPLPVFDVDAVMDTIATERITIFPGPPALYQSMLNHPGSGSLKSGSLRIAVTGAAPVPVSLIKQMQDDLGFAAVITAYGLSESTGIVTMCRQDDDPETISTSSGRAIPGVEVRVVADDGTDVATGEPGEILVRGYPVMQGYFEDPEKTAESIDPDGWLHTGDVGTMDARGYVDITDRTKDMFICGGFNAYPAEIESTLSEHPAVAQAAMVGVPDERLGEVGFAWLVPATGVARPSEAEVVAWSRERMANFKAPRFVRWVESLPLNPSGKIQKFILRDDAVAALADDPGAPS